MRRITRGNRFHAVAADDAIDRDHPLNTALLFWLMAPPGIPGAGGIVTDLTNKSNGALTAVASGANPWIQTPRGDTGINFTGVNYIVPAVQSLPATFTIVTWVRQVGAAAGTYYSVYSSTSNIGFWLKSQHINWFAGGDLAVGATTMASGQWYRVGYTYDGTTLIGYVNGVQDSSSTSSITLSSTYWIGADGGGPSELFTGQMSDFKFYNQPLTAVEMAADYEFVVQGYQTPDSPLKWVSTQSWFVPSSPPPTSVNFRSSLSGIGGRVGARQLQARN